MCHNSSFRGRMAPHFAPSPLPNAILRGRFKNYAERTVVGAPFGTGLTCVVGPNGAGKSVSGPLWGSWMRCPSSRSQLLAPYRSAVPRSL